MKKKPLVSIVTPCYNGEEFLDDYFEAILAQTYDNIELIFVNDGSEDDTEGVALKYKEVFEKKGLNFVYLYKSNGGQASAMNYGLKYISGKYLIWPDSDDLLASDSVEKRVIFLEKHPEYLFVRSNGVFFDYDTKKKLYRISNLENRFEEDIFLDLILETTYCCCGCYMIQSDSLKQIYPDLTIYESSEGQNWQILIPLAGKGKCGFIDEDLYRIAVRKNSHSRKIRNLDETVARYMELKNILEKGILLSERTDRNYKYIVDMKYNRILFRTYLKYGDSFNAKKYYKILLDNREVNEEDKKLYQQKFTPLLYKWNQFINLCFRGICKIKRVIFKR